VISIEIRQVRLPDPILGLIFGLEKTCRESPLPTASPRLGVVVPYRDRAEHLTQLLPHMAAYFTRDKIDKDIPVTLAIVEQPFGLPFNRGLIKNIGFKLLRDSIDYVCFHDVDFLPIWADFRWPDLPTMLIWYGYESQLIDPSQPSKRIW